MVNFCKILTICIYYLYIGSCSCRISKLDIKNDQRKYISLSTFGFYKDGILDVKLTQFKSDPEINENDVYGFTIDKFIIPAIDPYALIDQDHCPLESPLLRSGEGQVRIALDLKNLRLRFDCSPQLKHLHFYKYTSIPFLRSEEDPLTRNTLLAWQGRIENGEEEEIHRHSCAEVEIPIAYDAQSKSYNTGFVMYMATKEEEGSYQLYFHSCPNYGNFPVSSDFTVEIMENNKGNYLSAEEMPLPALYAMMSILFFLSGCFWVSILLKSKHPINKVHYLMAVLVLLKSLSLMFHSIKYHFIQIKGERMAAWSILYCITHLLEECILFITIMLLGVGWTSIKQIMPVKDKKIFMIVMILMIPVLVLANVATLMLEELPEGVQEHETWVNVEQADFLCFGAIIFSAFWSIRHLHKTPYKDSKALTSLMKLKLLFRHFFFMIIFYIYFTRIFIFILQMTLPFPYEWVSEMVKEVVIYLFFVLMGYKFRPTSENPYFQVTNENHENADAPYTIYQGKQKYRQADIEEFIKTPEVLNDMLCGENDGKAVVKA